MAGGFGEDVRSKAIGESACRRPSFLSGVVSGLTAVWLAGICACSWPTERSPYPETEPPDFAVASVSVEQGATDVERNQPLTITFTDRPDWETVSYETVRLTGGGTGVAVRYYIDLVACDVTLVPSELLQPGLTHLLLVEDDLESIAGAPLGERLEVSFTTGQATDLAPSTPDPVSDERIQQEVLKPRCGCCHDPETGTFRHVLALEAATVTQAKSRQLPALDIVEPGSHARSYLLHKVLGLPSIYGEPMPPPAESCGEPWPDSRECGSKDPELRLLGQWIAPGPLF
jgi:hypothetical protein